MKTEEWRDIPGYEGSYQASSLGRIRSLDRIGGSMERKYRLKGRVKRLRKADENSVTVTLSKDGHNDIRSWATFVWAAFNGAYPPNGMCVVHVDGNRDNHAPENLKLMSLGDVGRNYGRNAGRARHAA